MRTWPDGEMAAGVHTKAGPLAVTAQWLGPGFTRGGAQRGQPSPGIVPVSHSDSPHAAVMYLHSVEGNAVCPEGEVLCHPW